MQQCMWCICQAIALFGTDTRLKCCFMALLYALWHCCTLYGIVVHFMALLYTLWHCCALYGIVVLRIPYLQMIMVSVCLYFYTSSVVHVTFADVRGSSFVVVVVVVIIIIIIVVIAATAITNLV